MKNQYLSQKGFTLIEVLIALVILAMLVVGTMSGVRLAVEAKEISQSKIDTYQRLRFIAEQLNSKIRSLHPLFVPFESDQRFPGTADKAPTPVLAFEGRPDSIRFVTFGDKLDAFRKGSWMHEVHIYLGEHPDSGRRGILMMEREINLPEDKFGKDPALGPRGKVWMVAENVDHLRFRYYRVRPPESQSRGLAETPEAAYTGEWLDTLTLEPVADSGLKASSTPGEGAQSISLPRAIELSVGLLEPGRNGGDPAQVFLPPVIIPVYSGLIFERASAIENEKT